MAKLTELQAELAKLEQTLLSVEKIQQEPTAKRGICETNSNHGEYAYHESTNQLMNRTYTFKTACPHCTAEKITTLKKEIQVENQSEILRLKTLSNIPMRFAHCSLSNYEPVTDGAKKALAYATRYADKWLDRLAKGGGLVFCGKPGTGKNHLACAIANSIIENHQAKVLISTALRIARDIKNSWSRDSQISEERTIKTYTDKDLLIIDEIGVQFGSEAEKIILFEIINTRYEQMKPTILISNLSEQELGIYIGERVLDRMMEGQGAIIAFDWESYRK